MKRQTIVVVAAAVSMACGKKAPHKESFGAATPVECWKRASALTLSADQRAALCAGATDPDAPIACFKTASTLNEDLITVDGAVALCSTGWNLNALQVRRDAATLAQNACSADDLRRVEAKLDAIQHRLDELGAK